MLQPEVSVIIVTYQSADTISACLAALVTQDYPSYEIIVVDNASPDQSAALVMASFPQVKVLAAGVNLGFGNGANLGAAHASGQYLIFLNPDTIPATGFLTALMAEQEQHPTALVTAQITLGRAPHLINTAGNVVHSSGITCCRGLGRPIATAPYDRAGAVGAVSGAAFSISRVLFYYLGQFAGDFFLYLEDTELSLRARMSGYECRYAPAAIVSHRYGSGFGPAKFYYLERNRYWMLLRILRPATLLALLPSLLLSEAVAWGFALKSGPRHIWQKLRSYGWLGRNLPRILASREDVQRLRRRDDDFVLQAVSGELEFTQLAGPRLGRLAGMSLNPLFRLNLRLLRGGMARSKARAQAEAVNTVGR